VSLGGIKGVSPVAVTSQRGARGIWLSFRHDLIWRPRLKGRVDELACTENCALATASLTGRAKGSPAVGSVIDSSQSKTVMNYRQGRLRRWTETRGMNL
jgi:hypothetical protein